MDINSGYGHTRAGLMKKPTIAASILCFSHALSMELQKIHVIPQLVISFKIKRACLGVTVEPLEMAE